MSPVGVQGSEEPFYSSERTVSSIRLRAHRDVSEAALEAAAARISRLLQHCDAVRGNLARAGVELHVIGRAQAVSDLPMYRHLAGVPFDGDATIDERGRGYGGLHACCAEENLLALPSDRHADHRDVCSHELAHAVLAFGVDDAARAAVEAAHARAVARGRWAGAYAATNASELFAEATMWYVGSRGDYGAIDPLPHPGPGWLRSHDPELFALLDEIYTGARPPGAVHWEELPPATDARSGGEGIATRVVFVNRRSELLTLVWLDYDGLPRTYGRVGPEGALVQPTYADHVWELRDPEGKTIGRYAATLGPGRVSAGR